ncbi:primase C-terminal domain-containing protein [Tenacibaculum retecalamus]|uniref:primase C-terminal domain-containing protein n=1 Tax=Tenacibaculum retecalamus TaxID=3018315 RepID=UPI0023D936CB|nr:primase C-terminal domain-containing protein [Tenacibaculum retecalamus]WBX70869.1 BT4734/BF3469 family protein [Tenacibaculum retecalamus]
MINYYKSITKSSKVLGSVGIDKFLYTIKNGDEHLEQIKKARIAYTIDKNEYKFIKLNNLPCYTLNFKFNKTRKNANILDSTGFIYLDVDGYTDINLSNPLIFASWFSLSGNGRGILVKVENLDSTNFKVQYNKIAKALNINADEGARKTTQPNVLSYDPNLYVNYDSEKWEIDFKELTESKKDQYSGTNKATDIISTVVGYNDKPLRFDNLQDLIENVEFNGDVIHDFKIKIEYSCTTIPFKGIQKGRRNTIITAIAYQIKALNEHMNHERLLRLMLAINKDRCHEPLPMNEVKAIIDYVMRLEEITPNLNADRRFIFNSDYDLTTKQKRQEVIKVINGDRVKKSKLKVEAAIHDWDFIADGIITQKGLARKAKMNIKTIKKYYPLYKSEIQSLNKEYRTSNKSP